MHIDWGVAFASLIAPILAVWASEYRQRKRQEQDRQEWVFRTLMTTRNAKLQPHHVEALNHIIFAFPQESHPEVFDAWSLYHTHLNTDFGETPAGFQRWDEKVDDLFSNLVHLMAKDLKIPFSKSLIKSGSYYPKGFVNTELQQAEVRKLLLELLKNERSLSVTPKP